MAQTQELYEILVTTTGTEAVQALVRQLEAANRTAKGTAAVLDNSLSPAMERVGKTAVDMSNRFEETKNKSRNFALGISNVGFQVQDFVVQVTGGTNALRALGQQLPQALTAFSIGTPALALTIATLSTLAAIAPTIINFFINSGTAAKQAADSLKTYADALGALTSATSSAKGTYDAYVKAIVDGNSKLAESYAALAAAQRVGLANAARDAQAAADKANTDFAKATFALNQAQQAVRSQASAVQALAAQPQVNNQIKDQLEAQRAILDDLIRAYEKQLDARNALKAKSDEENANLDIAKAKLAEIDAMLGNIADGSARAANQAKSFGGALADARREGDGLSKSQDTAAQLARQLSLGLTDVGAWARKAADEAWRIAPAIQTAAHAALAFNVAAAHTGMGITDITFADIDRVTTGLKNAKSGGAAAKKELDGIVERSKTAIKALIDLHEAAVKQVTDVTSIVGQSMNSAFEAMVSGTQSVSSAFSDMLVKMLRDLAMFLVSRQVQSLMNLLGTQFGGAIGGAFGTPIAPAPGVAAYGAAFGTSMVGATNPGPPVNSAAMRKAMSGGGTTVNIINNAADVEVTAVENTRNGQEQLDIFVERKVKALIGSGRLDRAMRQNFGSRRIPT